MPRPLLMTAWLLAALATPAVAQTVSEKADSADVLVLDHDFGTVGEVVRVFLEDKQVYRAELSTTDATLLFRPRLAGMRVPRLYLVSDSRFSNGSLVIEIHPDQAGEYEIRPLRLRGSRISTHVRLYHDVNESGRRLTVANRPGL